MAAGVATSALVAYGLLFGIAPTADAATTVTTTTQAITGLQSTGDTDLQLGADITISQPIIVTASVTLDLDGHDLTISPPPSTTPATAGATALTMDGGTLDVSGEGLLTLRGGDGADGTATSTDGGAGGAGLAFAANGVLKAIALDIGGGSGGDGADATAAGQAGGAGGAGGVAIQVGTVTLQPHSGSVLILNAVGGSGGAGGDGGDASSGAGGTGGNGGAGAAALGAGATVNTPVELVSMVGGDGGPGGAGGDASGAATAAGDGGSGGTGDGGSYWQGIFAGVAGDGGNGGTGGDSAVAGVPGGDGGDGGSSARGGSGSMSVSGSGGLGGSGGTGGAGAADGTAGTAGADGGAPTWGNDSEAEFRLETSDGPVHYFAYPRNLTSTAQDVIDALPAWWPSGLGVPFYGWFTGPDGAGTPAGPQLLDGQPFYTFYSAPTQQQRVVTFDGNGGPGAGTVSVGYGDPVAAPSDPTRSGYRFDGWYDAAGSTGAAWDFSTPITEDLTLYAHWSEQAAPTTSPASGTPATPTTTAPTTTAAASHAVPSTPATDVTTGTDPLADTGADVVPVGLSALGLLAAGGAFLLAARRRRPLRR